jgi:hypothetical protein
MAKLFLTSIDLSKNQLLNAVIQNSASAPGSPIAGQIYFNTTDKNVYLWTGIVWADLTSGSIESIIGGSGLTASTVNGETTLDVIVDNVTLEIVSDSIRVKDVGITTAKIADSAVTTVKINANAVTFAKMQALSPSTVIGNMGAGSATPSEVVVITDLANATTNTLVTSSAVKSYVDNLIAKYDWMDLVRGYTTRPTLFATTATGKVYEYVYSTSTFYRFIATDKSLDAFYAESALTTELSRKNIIV